MSKEGSAGPATQEWIKQVRMNEWMMDGQMEVGKEM